MTSLMRFLERVPDQQKSNAMHYFLEMQHRQNKRLYGVYFEITPLCTLKCRMCYARITENDLIDSKRFVLSGDSWIDAARAVLSLGASCIYLTGGECTIHPNFIQIYNAIYDMGFEVIVMTNGTNFSNEIKEMFLRKPPNRISLTMYGFSENTYNEMCGNSNAYKKVMDAIDFIQRHKLPLTLKCTGTKRNADDIICIAKYAKEKSINFVYDLTLKASRECTEQIQKEEQIPYNECRVIENQISMLNNDYKDEIDNEVPVKQDSVNDFEICEKGMICGSGVNTFHLSWCGEMSPCVSFDAYKVYPFVEGFVECWKKIQDWSAQVPQLVDCQKCSYRSMCKTCVALHYADTHEFGKVSPRLCYKVQNGINNE